MRFTFLCSIFITTIFICSSAQKRSFKIDYDNNCFLKDGKPFRFISSSLHYFRVPQIYWHDRMSRLKSLGVNTIQAYIEWSQHEAEQGQYNFVDNLDIVKFFQTAQKLGLLVILRPGPYIDAERDFGGLPYWLLKNKNIKVRSSDPSFMVPLSNWFEVLLKKLKPLVYGNGGPIISVQVENEYGYYYTRDRIYTAKLRDIIRQHLGEDMLLFTTDGLGFLKYGIIPEVYATVDFGSGYNVEDAFKFQRTYSPKGPLVNSEFYTGWLDYWGHPHANVTGAAISDTLDKILSVNASVNMYMGHGGTSFGFTAGADAVGDAYMVCPTSYDYDGPISEAGDISQKFIMIRKVIQKYTSSLLPLIPLPVPKMALGPIQMQKLGSVLSALKTVSSNFSKYPLSFEDLGQAHGFVLYKTMVTTQQMDPVILNIKGIKDRGYVLVDDVYKGLVSRGEKIFDLSLSVKINQTISILVENQGRICFSFDDSLQDHKGIFPPITLGKSELLNWTMTKLPLSEPGWLTKTLETLKDDKVCGQSVSPNVPAFYFSHFQLPKDKPDFPLDTFLTMDGWFKGVAILNNFNLGRYWPVVGPQLTLYSPKNLFKPYPQVNTLVMLELENAPCNTAKNCFVEFVTVPEVNGPTPH